MATSASNEFQWIRYDLQGFSSFPKVSTYHKWSVLKSIADTLQDVGGADLVQQFASGCFGHLLRMSEGPTSAKSLIALMTYQIRPINGDDTEIWFVVGGRAIRMSPPEYALITGLNFGSSSFDQTAPHDPTGLSTYMRFTGGMRISVMELLNRFTEKNIDGGTEEDYLKAANILALYFFVLAVSERKKIDPWVWVLVDNLAAWDRFAWGAYSYGVLRHYIGEFPTKRDFMSARLHLYGPWWALQMWASEAIPTLGHVCSTIIAPSQVPRCLRRKFKNIPKSVDLDQLLRQEVQCFAALIPSDFEREFAPWISTLTGDPMGVQYRHVYNPIAPTETDADGLHIPRRHRRQPTQRPPVPMFESERRPEAKPERDMGSSSSSWMSREDMREIWQTEFLPELTDVVSAKVTETVTAKMTDFVKGLFQRSRRSRGPSPDGSHAPDESHGSRAHRSTPTVEGERSRDHRSTAAAEGRMSTDNRSTPASEGRMSTDHRSTTASEGGRSRDHHSTAASEDRMSIDHSSTPASEGGRSRDRRSTWASKGRRSRDRRRDTDMLDNVSEHSVHSYRPVMDHILEQEASMHSEMKRETLKRETPSQ